MNSNVNYQGDPGFHSGYNFNNNPQLQMQPHINVVVPQHNVIPQGVIVNSGIPGVVGRPGCKKCHGTGMKVKKGVAKPCKKCSHYSHVNVVGVSHGHGGHGVYHQKRYWCGCCKVDKKGRNKCKIKQCSIL
jgi:hypothetical protein